MKSLRGIAQTLTTKRMIWRSWSRTAKRTIRGDSVIGSEIRGVNLKNGVRNFWDPTLTDPTKIKIVFDAKSEQEITEVRMIQHGMNPCGIADFLKLLKGTYNIQ